MPHSLVTLIVVSGIVQTGGIDIDCGGWPQVQLQFENSPRMTSVGTALLVVRTTPVAATWLHGAGARVIAGQAVEGFPPPTHLFPVTTGVMRLDAGSSVAFPIPLYPRQVASPHHLHFGIEASTTPALRKTGFSQLETSFDLPSDLQPGYRSAWRCMAQEAK